MAPPSSSDGPPFAVPQGYAWDRDKRRFYRLDAKLAKVDSSEPHGRQDFPRPQSTSSQHLTTRAEALPGSVFFFTPAEPPAAFASISSPYGLPRDRPPSLASSRRWRSARVRRHAASLSAYSRDNLTSLKPGPDGGYANLRSAVRLSSFSRAGSLLWLMADEVTPFGSERVTLCFEQGNRQRGEERWMVNHVDRASDVVPMRLVDAASAVPRPIDEHPFSSSRSGQRLVAYGQWESSHILRRHDRAAQEGPLEVARHVRNRCNVAYGFNRKSEWLPRGLVRARIAQIGTEDVDELHPKHRSKEVSAAIVELGPSLEHHWGRSHDDRMDFFVLVSYRNPTEMERFSSLDRTCAITQSIEYGPATMPDMTVAKSAKKHRSKKEFHVMALNAGSGYCWVGHRDSSVQVIDTLDIFFKPLASFTVVHFGEITHQAVTNLLPVGREEVVVCFSDGAMALMQAQAQVTERGNHIVRTFQGHINDDGNMDVAACVDSESRLLAIRGSDGLIRIWHLDHPLPLNGRWHQSRPAGAGATDLRASRPSRTERLKAESTPGHSAAGVSDQKRFGPYDSLFYRDFKAKICREARKIPLSQLVTRQTVKMHWGHPSWVSTRDAQWEISRDVDPTTGLPRVIESGLLPSLALVENSTDGPRILWYEVGDPGLI